VDLVVRRWNWKAALTSSIVRGMIFFGANLGAGWHAALGAMGTEYLYRAITSGFYGAITQHLDEVEPEWEGALCAMIFLPLASHSLEFFIHWLRGTPNLKTSIVASLCFTAVSTLFNSYAMRRGTMVVGTGSRSIREDMRAMPRIVAGFVAAIPLWAWRSLRSREA
jgi:hypothetical protein